MGGLDRLELAGLEVACVIGDLPEEREREQVLVVDIALGLDLSRAGGSDALADTVDYAALAGRVRERLRAERCRMIERAAACVAEVCLAEALVGEARVRVAKSGCVPGLRAAAAEIVRRKSEGRSQRSEVFGDAQCDRGEVW